MKDELFNDLSASYKDIIPFIRDNRDSLVDLPILTRMEYEAIPLVDCFEAMRNYKNSIEDNTIFQLTTLMYYLTIDKRVEESTELPFHEHRSLLVGHNNKYVFQQNVIGALKGDKQQVLYKVKPEYSIGKMQFGVVNDNLVMAIKQNRIKGRIDPTMFPHNLPNVNLQMQETVLDLTEATHANLLKLQEVLQPEQSEPYYPNETGELPPNVFTPFNREYEAELHRRGWLPKDMWLSDVIPLMDTSNQKTKRVWVSENEIMRGKKIESLYQTIRMDANEHSI